VARRPEYITVGRFGRPRGVSGEIYITPATDDPSRFLELNDIIVSGKGRRRRLHLEAVEVTGGRPVAKIEGIDSRDQAAQLTNLSIEIPIDQVRELPEGSYYQFDLVGCQVVDEDGTEYGVIEEILFYPANDVYRIRSERFGEILFPVVDKFVLEVDIDGKRVVVRPPEGLFESQENYH
jgi:16S rRNA processing protein RimM